MKKSYIGIIGFGSQGKRIYEILKRNNYKNLIIFKKSKFNKNIKQFTNNFDLIKKCNIVFICSPNNTHYKYIKSLGRKVFIFCEKPPVNNINDLNKIKRINLSKVYFNYNYRFSEINSSLKNTKKYNFGKLLYGNIIMAHGLASKKKFNKSWRAKEGKGVYDILGIHLIDIINNNFKVAKISKRLDNLISNYSPDNAYFSLKLEKFGQVDCYVSYSSPFKQKFEFIFENGLLEINNNNIIFKGPRDAFNKEGFFISPPILFRKKFNHNNDYKLSLEKSMNYFLNCVKKKLLFKIKDTKISLQSNELMLRNSK